ncbi:MAG: 3-dehydroquinate dehydratase [Acholeplasmataceae bacterium]|nr:3-dehydroquinate dehydratase [Acholeplasmataceae bacterium]
MNLIVIHGPNLNMLGRRNKEIYGSFTLEELYEELSEHFPTVDFTFFQSNYEGELIDIIHHALDDDYQALLINPGALTHYSYALRDALELLKVPKVEVHLTNIMEREAFRKVDVLDGVVERRFMGKKIDSYIEAITFLLDKTVV